MKAMKFKLPRDRTIASTCGISIEFKRGEFHLVPPAMFAEVIAAGGVSENDIPEEDMPAAAPTPDKLAEREAAMMTAFAAIATRGNREDFTAGGVPHSAVLSRELGWAVQAKERDAAWLKFQAGTDD
jgi:hypothetical protein